MRNETCATLSSSGELTSFSYGGNVIRFRTSPKLDRYLEVKKWDHGYLVVDALYKGLDDPVEEYIDLVPILRNLYFDPDTFVSPIRSVQVAYQKDN